MELHKQHRLMFKGRTFGITLLTFLQISIGIVHILFGFSLLLAPKSTLDPFLEPTSKIYSYYTMAFGFATTFFAYGIWLQEKWGSYGTIATSLFVTIADILTIFNLPSVPGIPQFAAVFEVLYSIFIMLYLLQINVKNH